MTTDSAASAKLLLSRSQHRANGAEQAAHTGSRVIQQRTVASCLIYGLCTALLLLYSRRPAQIDTAQRWAYTAA